MVAPEHARGPAGQRGLERPGEPAARATSACRRSCRTRTTRRATGRSCRASASSRRPTTARSWTPRNEGLRADWPRENDEVGFCVHKLVMSPVDNDRLYQQNHVGMHRSDDAGQSWTEITEGLPTEFGFAAAAHPHDRDTFYVDPARPRPRALHARRPARPSGARATPARRGSGSTTACPQQRRPPRRAARGDGDRHARRARRLLRHEHGSGVRERRRGRELDGDRELPARRSRPSRSRSSTDGRRSTCPTLPPLFPGLPRRLDLDAATVDEAIDRLDERWPGLRDRLCEPGPALRHAHPRVRRPRARRARHRARAALARRRDRRDQRRLIAVRRREGLICPSRRREVLLSSSRPGRRPGPQRARRRSRVRRTRCRRAFPHTTP